MDRFSFVKKSKLCGTKDLSTFRTYTVKSINHHSNKVTHYTTEIMIEVVSLIH